MTTALLLAMLSGQTIQLRQDGVKTGLPAGQFNCSGGGITCVGPSIFGGVGSIVVTGTSGDGGGVSYTFAAPVYYDGGTVGCLTASGSIAGCLSSSNWTTFNNKVTSVSGTAPIISSGGTTPAISLAPFSHPVYWDGGTIGLNIPACLPAQALNWSGSAMTCVTAAGLPSEPFTAIPPLYLYDDGGTTVVFHSNFSAPVYWDGGTVGLNIPACMPTEALSWSGSAMSCITAAGLTSEPFEANPPLYLYDDGGTVGISTRHASHLSGFFPAGITPAAAIIVAGTRVTEALTTTRLSYVTMVVGTGGGTYTLDAYNQTTSTVMCVSGTLNCTGAVGGEFGGPCSGTAATADDIVIRVNDGSCATGPVLNIALEYR